MTDATAHEFPDEAGRRRPGFRRGSPVVMADGREWHLRCPTRAEVGRGLDCGGEFSEEFGFEAGRLVEAALVSAERGEMHGSPGDAYATIAAFVLMYCNYDLATGEFLRLIGLSPVGDGFAIGPMAAAIAPDLVAAIRAVSGGGTIAARRLAESWARATVAGAEALAASEMRPSDN